MSEWQVQYRVDFTETGDRTNLAISKHISEIARLYSLLGQLRSNFSGAGYPSDAVRNQLYINPNTFAAKVFVGISGEDDWRDLVCVPARHDLDKHNAGVMQDLQDLVSDAFLLFLATAPGAADSGKVVAVGADGGIGLAALPTELAPTTHGPDKHSAGSLAQMRALVSDGWLAALAAAPAAVDIGKALVVGDNGDVALSAQTFASLAERITALEARVAALEAPAA